MINKRLFEHYDIDTNKNLQIKTRCPRPFDTVLIDKQGSCYACECQSWLPQSIGNLQIQTLSEILQSKMAEHLQSSIILKQIYFFRFSLEYSNYISGEITKI